MKEALKAINERIEVKLRIKIKKAHKL